MSFGNSQPVFPIVTRTPIRRNTFQQKIANNLSTTYNENSLLRSPQNSMFNKTYLFSPTSTLSPTTGTNNSEINILKHDIRRLRTSLERKDEQINWWMDKSKNDNVKYEGLKTKMNKMEENHDKTIYCIRSMLDGLTFMNHSIKHLLRSINNDHNHDKEEEENKENDNIDQTFLLLSTTQEQDSLTLDNSEVDLLLLAQTNSVCLKLAANIDKLIRTNLLPITSSTNQADIDKIHQQQSNASAILEYSRTTASALDFDDGGPELLNSVKNDLYQQQIDKLNDEMNTLRIQLKDKEKYIQNLEEQTNNANRTYESSCFKYEQDIDNFKRQLTTKDEQILSVISNEHEVLRQLIDEKNVEHEKLHIEYKSLLTKYQSECSRNIDLIVTTDELHDKIRIMAKDIAVKEVNEEKLRTQANQMKKMITLMMPQIKKQQKKTFGHKMKRQIRESFSSLVSHKTSSNGSSSQS
ncbi:unnamed protein product [Didymodactylos carnosus]|uniref:Uncharacterized protein n=1 Tax=Didymodactylos carnosus TaxID=1234261 RepID=A0A814DM86_9BILA|nr:unnamed protein product [Didymodactylos carnosus]CAF1141907.1 unnamed protein product [Didymodactylos carnosus]CAF3731372.1 unnamed protein product [Didymodactylos carnosus]CAF3938434.1 unnamed protein product [Didymodactylos carnosus]